jgi:hypothetical protein
MRPLAVALASLGLLDLLLARARGWRLGATVAFAGTVALTGGLVVGCSATGAAVLAVTVVVESGAWVAARRDVRPAAVLTTLGAALLARCATTGLWHVSTTSLLDRWVSALPYGGAVRLGPDRLAYVTCTAFFLAAAGNTYVRLLLRSIGSLAPSDEKAPGGGRVIGSIERVLIFALAVSGDAAAATLVISAKGILRFAEVRATRHEDIDSVTEYVLVGSLASYALALAFVPLALA